MQLQPDGEEAADMSVRYQQGHLRCVERKNGPQRSHVAALVHS